MTRPHQNETQLSAAIVKALRDYGCVVVRVQSGSVQLRGRRMRLAEPGTPDLCVLSECGTTTWMEVKTAHGALSEAQETWHALARGLGHRVFVVRSVSEALAHVGHGEF